MVSAALVVPDPVIGDPDMIPLGPLRGRGAATRNAIGRAATVGGGLAAAATTVAPHLYLYGLAGAGAGICCGALWALTLPAGRVRDSAAALYLAPSLSLAVLLTVGRFAHLVHWWELLADLAWTVAAWRWRPARVGRVLAGREPAATYDAFAQAMEPAAVRAPVHEMSLWWQRRVAVDKGAAPNTELDLVEQTGLYSMQAVIRSTVPGAPVPAISVLELSALLNWPEDEITITPMPRQGAGVRRLTVGQAPADAGELDPFAHWSARIAPKGMAGTRLVKINEINMDKEIDA
jgi:hypothetical protein